MANNNVVLEKKKALDLIQDSARNYLSAKLTLPLGNPDLKKVHTNQFLWTELPDEFSLKNWGVIAEVLGSSWTRYSGYEANRWYVEAVTIDVERKGKAEMSLDLNAFASSTSSYTEGYRSMVKAYQDAQKKTTEVTKTTNAQATSSTKSKSNATTNGKNTSLKGGWGHWVDTKVKSIVGTETDPLKKAKLLDKEFKRVTHWRKYYDAQKTKGIVSNYEKAYKSHYLNCADGANILCAWHNSAGITSTIMHTTEHYIVRMTINGKYYWTDCSAANGQLCNKAFNVVYGYKGGTNVGTKISYN